MNHGLLMTWGCVCCALCAFGFSSLMHSVRYEYASLAFSPLLLLLWATTRTAPLCLCGRRYYCRKRASHLSLMSFRQHKGHQTHRCRVQFELVDHKKTVCQLMAVKPGGYVFGCDHLFIHLGVYLDELFGRGGKWSDETLITSSASRIFIG